MSWGSARGVELVSCFGAYISAALPGTLPLTRVVRNGSAGYIVNATAVEWFLGPP
jgi:hypothetical protein